MKFLIFSLLLSSHAFAETGFDTVAEDCVNRVSEALGFDLALPHNSVTLEGAGCQIDLSRSAYVSGFNQLPVVELKIRGSERLFTTLNANEGLATVMVTRCDVSESAISVAYSGKQKFADGGKYSGEIRLQLLEGKIVSANVNAKRSAPMGGSRSSSMKCLSL